MTNMASTVTDASGRSWTVTKQLVTDITKTTEVFTVGYGFLVKYDRRRYSVYRQGGLDAVPEKPDDLSTEAWAKLFYRDLVHRAEYVRVMAGKSPFQSRPNSLLFEESDGRYVCVFNTLVAFRPRERIDRFESPVQVGVSFPYAIGATTSYLLAAGCIVPHFELPPDCRCPYEVAYMDGIEDDARRRALSAKYIADRPIPGFEVITRPDSASSS